MGSVSSGKEIGSRKELLEAQQAGIEACFLAARATRPLPGQAAGELCPPPAGSRAAGAGGPGGVRLATRPGWWACAVLEFQSHRGPILTGGEVPVPAFQGRPPEGGSK